MCIVQHLFPRGNGVHATVPAASRCCFMFLCHLWYKYKYHMAYVHMCAIFAIRLHRDNGGACAGPLWQWKAPADSSVATLLSSIWISGGGPGPRGPHSMYSCDCTAHQEIPDPERSKPSQLDGWSALNTWLLRHCTVHCDNMYSACMCRHGAASGGRMTYQVPG